ncbi:MAG: hypothetical protein LKF82_13715 [Acinetobacter populi]|jgi:hypothetical protein|uniref:hypothetical protein n=1 Tax=Acinetobacter populi TaxID=1582270 RepID=UPI0023525575|nr:hypothetical protein [Acinetobacter populi]MCH4248863.1 hypothetical protein [Acinetobacter populi]
MTTINHNTDQKYSAKAMLVEAEAWLNAVMLEKGYCHYFAVVTADDSSPIGYHPSTESEYFYTLEEASAHQAALRQANPKRDYLLISGSVTSRYLKNAPHTKWVQQHQARLEKLQGVADEIQHP